MNMIKAMLHTDGGARGNPGPAGIGYVLKIAGKKTISGGEYIGEGTNNYAEYTALIRGLTFAQQHNVQELTCYLDSELVVKQLAGEYRVRHHDLLPLHKKVKQLATKFSHVAFHHVRREKNARADELVNEAIDAALNKKARK